jgi:hypothetical protein
MADASGSALRGHGYKLRRIKGLRKVRAQKMMEDQFGFLARKIMWQ